MVNFEFHIRFVSFKICCLCHVENYKFHHGLKLVSKVYMYFPILFFHYSPTKKKYKRVFCLQNITTQYFYIPPTLVLLPPYTPPFSFTYLRCRGFWHSVTGRELGPAPGVQAWEEGDLGWGGGGLALLAGARLGPARASGGWFCIRGCRLFFVLST